MFNLKYFKRHLFAPPIFRASYSGNVEKLRRLLEAGADVNARERDGLTPLMVASVRGNSAAAELLIQHGSAVNAQDNNGLTPLIFASINSKKLLYTIQKYHHDVIERCHMMTIDGKVNYLNTYKGYTDNYTDIANILIQGGADVNAVSKYSMTSLMNAALSGNKEMTKLLLSKGAAVNAKNNDGATPLMLAIMRGFSSVVKILIEHGADVNAADNDGMPVMAFASIKKNQEILQLLRDKGAKGEITSSCQRKA